MSVTAPGQGQDRPELRKAIEEIVESGLLGVQPRVNDVQGEWAGSAGARELGQSAKPLTGGHFRIGSSTKNSFSASVFMPAAEGDIGLDAPAGDHLPGSGLDRRITVRMLLRHTTVPDDATSPWQIGADRRRGMRAGTRYSPAKPTGECVQGSLPGPEPLCADSDSSSVPSIWDNRRLSARNPPPGIWSHRDQ
ncbi:serine hydrolase [Streptomyces sp.]|uniref:serine hydrolase n=1 Tax=Streptomyces sp. TaxID=1931 RepID=UPI002F940750